MALSDIHQTGTEKRQSLAKPQRRQENPKKENLLIGFLCAFAPLRAIFSQFGGANG
jgi:hypothetical protein